MKKDAITFETICSRLERAIHAEVGREGLDILIYGWLKRNSRLVTRQSLWARLNADGEEWLTPYELDSFSRYAGYDLTKD